MNKKQFGQFFTKNTDYILQDFSKYIAEKNITDPFAGDGDLLKWAKKNKAKSTIGFDIDENYVDKTNVFFRDSLSKPFNYEFVLTNPPYLYQNKLEDNSILKNSKHTDLFQISLEKIMLSKEGIVIVPINFLSAENSKYIRELFFNKFEIVKINYFTEQVFADTTYNVIAFYYKLKTTNTSKMQIDFSIYPENIKIKLDIFQKFNWQIGGEFLNEIKLAENKLKIKRLEETDLNKGENVIKTAYNHLNDLREFNVDKTTLSKLKNNIILLKAIDTGTDKGKICLEDIRDYNLDALVSIKTSRNQIYLLFPDNVSIEEQKKLIELFNATLNQKRKRYFSLFMTNFRDKNRKRISFNFAYKLLNYLYFTEIKGEKIVKTELTLF
ncbi:MAG: hypothetical protein ACTSXL_04990 [Alphaproteobacteria bacterium]